MFVVYDEPPVPFELCTLNYTFKYRGRRPRESLMIKILWEGTPRPHTEGRKMYMHSKLYIAIPRPKAEDKNIH